MAGGLFTRQCYEFYKNINFKNIFEITWNSEPLVHRFSQICCFQKIPAPFCSNYRSYQKID